MGPGLVQNLEGSDQAKDRLQVMLESLFGLPIEEACRRLGIAEAMLHRLRMRALQGALEALEPRRRGRPKHPLSGAEQTVQALETQLQELQDELRISELRHEIDWVLPHIGGTRAEKDEAVKKTTQRRRRKKGMRRQR